MRRQYLVLASAVLSAALIVWLLQAPTPAPSADAPRCPALAEHENPATCPEGALTIREGLHALLSQEHSEGRPVLFVSLFEGSKRVYLESFDGVSSAKATVAPATGAGAHDLLVVMGSRTVVIRCAPGNLPGKVLDESGRGVVMAPGEVSITDDDCSGKLTLLHRWNGREFVPEKPVARLF